MPESSESTDDLFDRAANAHESGDLHTAESLYRSILAKESDDAAVLELLGQVLLASMRAAEARSCLERSVSIDPASAGAWLAYSMALHAEGLSREAAAAAERSLRIDPGCLDTRVMLAVLRLEDGRGSADAASMDHLLEHESLEDRHIRILSGALSSADQSRSASQLMRRLASPDDADAEAMFALSKRLFRSGDLGDMEALLQHLHGIRPGHARAARVLADHLANARREQDALAVLESTLQVVPNHADLHLQVAEILDRVGRREEADRHVRLGESGGENWGFRWRRAARCLRSCYESEAELASSRERLDALLLEAANAMELGSRRHRDEGLATLLNTNFFLLPAQGRCDRDTASRIGAVTREVVGSIDRALLEAPESSSSSEGGRLRVGVLSGFFRSHSNWKTHLNWLSRLDPERFELVGYCTQPTGDSKLEEARRRFVRLVVHPEDPLALARRIREDRLHAVLIPEVGMDPMVRVVAAARLAPVQWCSWGHATTSGYPSVNGYLSSDLMESAEADAHYSEPLIRLSGVGGGFAKPTEVPEATRRSDLGIGTDEVAVWCAHAPFTHLPQHDQLLIRIAERRPEVRFVFVAMAEGDPTRRRIESAFRAADLDPERLTRFLPRLSASQFLGANAVCDLYLDTPEWSGCNTGLETILMGCPPITLPGRFMRGRHLWAFLQRMEMPELAAWSLDEYVDLAVEMVADPDRRREAVDRLSERREVLFDDPAPREALEERLEEACRSS